MNTHPGQVAFITGGASGIGLGMARAFGEAGMRLVLADIEAGALEAARSSLSAAGHDVLALHCGVARYGDLRAAADRTMELYGAVHLVCNNAGVGLEGPIETWTDEAWAWVVGVNVMGVVHGVRAFTPLLKANPVGGHIINTASIGGLMAAPNHGRYAASKFAVVGLSQTLRSEPAPHGIGVTALCPGFARSRIANGARNAPDGLAEVRARG